MSIIGHHWAPHDLSYSIGKRLFQTETMWNTSSYGRVSATITVRLSTVSMVSKLISFQGLSFSTKMVLNSIVLSIKKIEIMTQESFINDVIEECTSPDLQITVGNLYLFYFSSSHLAHFRLACVKQKRTIKEFFVKCELKVYSKH